jgi:hypothetical protein
MCPFHRREMVPNEATEKSDAKCVPKRLAYPALFWHETKEALVSQEVGSRIHELFLLCLVPMKSYGNGAASGLQYWLSKEAKLALS